MNTSAASSLFALLELRQETDVAVEEQAQIVDAIAQHGQAVRPHAEGEADVLSGSSPMLRTTLGCTWPEPATSSQRPPRAGLELDVDFGTGLVNGKKLGRNRSTRSSLSKKVAEIREDDLQILEAHVLANPQAFALVEHGRMRGIAVHAVGAAWAITRISGMAW